MNKETLPVPSLTSEIERIPWYHTIELPGGVVTPGRWDTRAALARIPFPASLAGKRCLDVGTFDGFWAFEMERRGASEVVGIDLQEVEQLDWPALPPADVVNRQRAKKDENPDRGFDVASKALGSTVEHRSVSVYDLSPEAFGMFDFAFVGSILVHLRDPVRALSAVRGVLQPQGQLLVADQVSLSLTLLQPRRPTAHVTGFDEPVWWTPNLACFRRYLHAAGYEVERSGGPFRLRAGAGAARQEGGLANRLNRRTGVPHAWALGHPRAAG